MDMHRLPPHLRFFSPAALIATFFGSGLLKPASGTWGSLAALAPGLLIAERFGASGLLVGAALAYGLGHWASTVWINGTEDKDPSPIVIDEVAGLWLTLTLAPLTPLGAALAFGLFRWSWSRCCWCCRCRCRCYLLKSICLWCSWCGCLL